jgi:DNA-binding transcriptional MerR regulator
VDQIIPQETLQCITSFHLPRYQSIPDVGLYLEQTSKYISDYYEPLGNLGLTGSMISNYVKQKLIPRPVRKQYGRDQIAYLIFIAAAKQVLSMDHIRILIDMQQQSYPISTAYNYFCDEFEQALQQVFDHHGSMPAFTERNQQEKSLLRMAVITAANMIYLGKSFEILSERPLD